MEEWEREYASPEGDVVVFRNRKTREPAVLMGLKEGVRSETLDFTPRREYGSKTGDINVYRTAEGLVLVSTSVGRGTVGVRAAPTRVVSTLGPPLRTNTAPLS